tara:strand:+ start:655 stop:1020 length:366 start_codon:yes stop_codon:yes gene_type:complete
MNYSNVIEILCPNSKYTITENIYSTLVWESTNSLSKPIEQEIIDKETTILNESAYMILRDERDKLLTESDKYTLSDYPHSSESTKTEWLTYRQSLRDITKQVPSINSFGEIINIVWPSHPQ